MTPVDVPPRRYSFIDGFYFLTALGLYALGGANQVRV